ncbi:hypothetical protein BRC93_07165 [Halobacteriales archaeon QS_5_70_15]|nr:MAG: hypothetical protein BRC93_07165 [Halobacteriales archaeon QS_5_70_15]
MTEATPETEQLMSEYVALWNGDFSKVTVVSESFTLHQPNAPEEGTHGREAFEAHLSDLHEGFPDHHLTIDDMLAIDELVMTEWTMTGTHAGEYNGVPPTERELELTGMAKTLVADGGVREDRLYCDRQEMFEQLGLTEE